MKNNKVYEISVISVFTAMIVVMALVPMLGFIQIFAISLTLIHIPVLIGGIFGGRKAAIYLGAVFGIMSLIIAFMRPANPVDMLFQNPLISVLPRVLFGYFLYEIYLLARRWIKNPFVAITTSMVVSTIVHTILVLIPLYLIGEETLVSLGVTASILPFIWGVLISNGFLEAILAGLVGGPIAQRLLVYKDSE